MTTLKQRLMRVTLTVRGSVKTYEQPMAIKATGSIYGSPQPSECNVTLTNLSASDRDYLLSTYTIWRRGLAISGITVEAGREGMGLARVFKGVIVSSSGGQPPDIKTSLKCMEGYGSHLSVGSVTAPSQAPLNDVAAMVAKENGLTLDYQADDRQVSNFSVSGSMKAQIDALAATGAHVYQEGDRLVVKNSVAQPLRGGSRLVSEATGMIGVPELDELGVKVKILFEPGLRVGQSITVRSKLNPAANGVYTAYNIGYDLSTREDAWYASMTCTRQNFAYGRI